MLDMTGDPLHVPLAELREAFDIVLNHIEAATKSSAVDLEEDYFWSIPPATQYDVYDSPADLTIGQLSESWQNIKDLLADPDHVVGYHLVWLADVLRAMGHRATG